MRIDPERQRERAAALTAMLTPLIEAHLSAGPVVVKRTIDDDVHAAVEGVVKAVDRLEQTKYTSAERRARVSLEIAAKRLRAVAARRKGKLNVR